VTDERRAAGDQRLRGVATERAFDVVERALVGGQARRDREVGRVGRAREDALPLERPGRARDQRRTRQRQVRRRERPEAPERDEEEQARERGDRPEPPVAARGRRTRSVLRVVCRHIAARGASAGRR
jgi:hypothetical protein